MDSTGLDTACTHYAFEVVSDAGQDAEGNDLGECYVFDGCSDQHEDTYTIYALTALGCTETLATGGCVDQRCDKNTNPSNKPCDKDTEMCAAPDLCRGR